MKKLLPTPGEMLIGVVLVFAFLILNEYLDKNYTTAVETICADNPKDIICHEHKEN